MGLGWTYKGYKLKKLPDECIGFVYCIHYTDGTKYIGKKLAKTTFMLPALKNGEPREFSKRVNRIIRRDENGNIVKGKKAVGIKGKMEAWDVLDTETSWISYKGSSKHCKGKTILTKVITHLCTNKLSMSYLETKELFAVDATINDKYINDCVAGSYWDNCLDGLYTGPVDNGGLFDGTDN